MELIGASTGQSSGQVWIENHPTEGWVPGRVDSLAPSGSYVVVDDSGEQFEVPQDKARPVDPACLRGVDDLLDLGDFNEGALLHNIRVRYFKDEIYTGIGNPILISVNPYASLPALYSEAKQKFYRDRGQALSTGDAKLPPHLFSVAASSYMSMLGESKNQSIIISGESGAGKTEATKRILTYFANLQSDSLDPSKREMSIEQQVLRSNPILEAFGNAKTIRNDNSSRFGKYMDIEFEVSGKLQSARITNYLLEKCRIVKQQPDERNYHSFYLLCAGASADLRLSSATQHAYTCGLTEVPGVDDHENYEEMVECMLSLGFSAEEKASIFKITAAVIHLGDLDFEPMPDTSEGTKISDQASAAHISEMLGVDVAAFKKVFQYKTLEDPFTKKVIDMPQDVTGASNTRHSMAKVAYSRLFDWLVWRINQSMTAKVKGKECRKIGILDIYGFEVFEWNSFEQLCINFANEKLQQHFNAHMFTLEQQLYTEEGITWSHITWQDNREIIDSLEKKPLGVFSILDSECIMPNASDTSCLNKIYSSFKNSKIVYKPSRFASTNFGVAHYAGEVIYDIVSFLEKNTDKLHADIMNLLKSSKMELLKSLFTNPLFAPELAAPAPKTGASGAAAKSRANLARGPSGGADGGRAKQNVTVGMSFREQLDKLVEDLNKTHPRYIRCIKPNANKQPHDCDSLDVQRQLRCAGMLESIRIRRAGYSVRRPFKEFFNRFRVLVPHLSTGGRLDPDYKELSRRLLTDMEGKLRNEKEPIEAKSWQIGRSKVFLKEDLQTILDKRIGTAVAGYVIKVQKRWRGYKQKKRYKAMKKAGIALQAALRTVRAIAEYRAERDRCRACVAIQAALRTAALQRLFVRRRAAAIKIEKVVRGWRCRQKIGKLKGKKAEERIQKLREEEARAKELETAKKEAEEKERAMKEMQEQLQRERERAQEEAQRQLAEKQHELDRTARAAQAQQEKAAESQNEKLKQEMLEMRNENARLQGRLDAAEQKAASAASAASDAEVEQLRRELQEVRREKARMEVELATSASSADYEALLAEVSTVRQESSDLRRAKLDAEVQLEQRIQQLDSLQAQVERANEVAVELEVVKTSHDEMQLQIQRLQAAKAGLEERVKGEDAVRTELRDLRMEKMRIEGELDTSKVREEALADKLKIAEKSVAELHQQRQKFLSSEAELDASRAHVDKLQMQVQQLTKDGSTSRSDSLDQLRNELLSRIEAKPSVGRPSIGRPSFPPGASPEGISGFSEEGGRATLMNQRQMFEQLKQQFNSSKVGVTVDDVGLEDALPQTREVELEEELREVRKENVELNIRISSQQDELAGKDEEVQDYRNRSAAMQAELQDLKFQAEHHATENRRMAADSADAKTKLREVQSELQSARARLGSAEERVVRSEEDLKASAQRCMRLERELETAEVRMHDFQRQASEAIARERAIEPQIEEARQVAEKFRKIAEESERSRVEGESSSRFLTSENERLIAELADAHAERNKIKEVMEELVRAEGQSRSEELGKEVDKWKTRASYFEREYNRSKELNQEMTNQMSQMLQAVSDRTGESGDLVQQNKVLKKQLEGKGQEIKMARMEKEDVQRQLDSLQSTGAYFQDKYREVNNELKGLKQEHSVAAASVSKLRARVESLQKENEDLKVQCTQLTVEIRAGASDVGRIEKYEQHVRELEAKIQTKEDKFQKSQAVNDCLNTLLVLESEQASLWESSAPRPADAIHSQLLAKKSKAQDVISRLNMMLTEEERPSMLERPSMMFN